MIEATECECSEEYGPCERHGVVVAQREGSSSRSADELCTVFLEDAQSIDAGCLSPYGVDVLKRANDALAAAGPFSHWVDDPDLADELRDVVTQVENYIGPDYWTYWDDGYRIVKPAPDCPLLAELGSAVAGLLVGFVASLASLTAVAFLFGYVTQTGIFA